MDQDVAIMTGEPMPPNCEVLRADVRELASRAGAFDVVHARFVLLHLPDRDEVTALAASLLADGGHLVVTEPYALATGGRYPVVDEVMNAYNAYADAVGMDLRGSKTVPGLLGGLGHQAVHQTERLPLIHGRNVTLRRRRADRRVTADSGE